ncbi:MAG: hypothetical protein J1G07_00725 [Clostridiales bacterium]|nr:hypothetical protein [Clostridiales bacterium]
MEENKGKKIRLELVDLLSGAAFPLMIMIILSASIMSFATSDDMIMNIIILVVGELLLIAVLMIFGKQNGVYAYRKSVQQAKKREIGTSDVKSLLGVGEYAIYKGFIIGFITCVPFIIFQMINCIFPNSFCEFLLIYAFGWAYLPLSYIHASEWLNVLWIIPALCVHALAYFIGGKIEKKKQDDMAARQKVKDKKKKA